VYPLHPFCHQLLSHNVERSNMKFCCSSLMATADVDLFFFCFSIFFFLSFALYYYSFFFFCGFLSFFFFFFFPMPLSFSVDATTTQITFRSFFVFSFENIHALNYYPQTLFYKLVYRVLEFKLIQRREQVNKLYIGKKLIDNLFFFT
jgi:hypothetical protein